jgi:hypothetical protein
LLGLGFTFFRKKLDGEPYKTYRLPFSSNLTIAYLLVKKEPTRELAKTNQRRITCLSKGCYERKRTSNFRLFFPTRTNPTPATRISHNALWETTGAYATLISIGPKLVQIHRLSLQASQSDAWQSQAMAMVLHQATHSPEQHSP